MLTTTPTWTLIDSTTDDTTGDLRASEPYQRFRWECADGRKAEATIRAYVYAHQHRDDERTVYGIEARVTVREYDSATPWASVETSAMPVREETDTEPINFFWAETVAEALSDAREWIAVQDPARFFPEYT